MASFTVRIVLYDVKDLHHSAYSHLHAAMEKANFSTTIRDSTTKVRYQLPPAEYHYLGDITIEEVRDKASEIVKEIDRNSAVFVTEGETIVWRGLDRV